MQINPNRVCNRTVSRVDRPPHKTNSNQESILISLFPLGFQCISPLQLFVVVDVIRIDFYLLNLTISFREHALQLHCTTAPLDAMNCWDGFNSYACECIATPKREKI